jgi:dolichyl-phosphate-mannose-protein mannosyltransferase
MADVAAQAPRLPAGEASLLSFSFRIPAIVPLLALGLAVRLALAFVDGFQVDIGTFRAWSGQLANDGPWNFYKDAFFTDYAPGYMYVLWAIGELDQRIHFTAEEFEYILKVPSILADLASAALLYIMLRGQKPGVRIGASAAYLFFPPALFIGALWGQVDSILAFLTLLSVYFISKDRPVAAAVTFVLAFLTKPQAIAALPILAFWIVREHPPAFFKRPAERVPGESVIPRVLIECTVIPLVVLLVLITPFFKLEPWRLVEVLSEATDVYPNNSFWAYNFWNMGGLFDWGFRCDGGSGCNPTDAENATEFLGIATRAWGIFLFGSSVALTMFALRNVRGTGFLALGVALSVLAFYIFLTRMHERYVFPAFLPMLLACALIQSRALWAGFVAASTIHFFNLYHVFSYYYFYNAEQQQRWSDVFRFDTLNDWLAKSDWLHLGPIGDFDTVQVLSVAIVATFLAMLAWTYVITERRSRAALL